MRKYRIALKDNAALRRRLGHDRAIADDDDTAALLLLAEQNAQERRFSAAAGADQRQEFAGLGGDVDPLEHAGIAITLFQPVNDDAAHLASTGCAQGDTAWESRTSSQSVMTASSVIQAT